LDKFKRHAGRRLASQADAIMVIGLGRFGLAVARSLVRLGHEVLAVDAKLAVVEAVSQELPNVVQADCADVDTLRQLDVESFSHVVVAIGHDLEASVLTVLNLSQLNIADIWVKATNAQHARIVERLGAHHIIFPEADMGARVAHLVTGKMIDFIEFLDGFAIAKTRAPAEMHGKALAESRIRQSKLITVVGLKRLNQDFLYAQPETVVEPDDLLVVAGATADVERFAAGT
jgi:trk system potassium uptake protein TrkA